MDTGITVGDDGDSRFDEAATPLPAMPIAVVMVVTVEKEEIVVAEAAEAVFQRKPSPSPLLSTRPQRLYKLSIPPEALPTTSKEAIEDFHATAQSFLPQVVPSGYETPRLRCRLSRGRGSSLLAARSGRFGRSRRRYDVRSCLPLLESIAPR